jgi:glycosyltransferase involved in cell wall biosynthesis
MNTTSKTSPQKTELLVPPGATAGPVELSIVVPAMNEKITVGEFVDWCREGLEKANVSGQIMIVDSSSDETPDIALFHGAEVLRTPKRGLGRAYIDSIPFIRGKWIIMGDADLTYDFRHLGDFADKFREGNDFIMGSRFKGTIEEGAMPWLHQYFGTPLTTWMLNFIYGSHFSDIHCGMRGVTLKAFERMRMRSQSWQYAPEMIIKSLHLRLRSTEVPIIFHKDRDGRLSHYKRSGPFGAWYAGWMTLQALCTYGADFFLFKPGLALFAFGAVGVALLYSGPLQLGPLGLSLHWMLFFVLCTVVGFQSALMGVLAKTIYDYERTRSPGWKRFFTFNRSVIYSGALLVVGFLSGAELIATYIHDGMRLGAIPSAATHRAVAGIGVTLLAAIYFTFGLVFNALVESALPDGEAVARSKSN